MTKLFVIFVLGVVTMIVAQYLHGASHTFISGMGAFGIGFAFGRGLRELKKLP